MHCETLLAGQQVLANAPAPARARRAPSGHLGAWVWPLPPPPVAAPQAPRDSAEGLLRAERH